MLDLKHKQLEVWKQSIKLINEIYKITSVLPPDEKFGLVSQLRRASVSVAANLAEGSARKSGADRARFYEISRSSVVEIDTHIEICIQLTFLDKNSIADLEPLIRHVYSMITKMITLNKDPK